MTMRTPLQMKVVRIARGLRAVDVASATGVTQGTITRVELGDRIPGPELRRRIATLLNKPEADLFRPAAV
ncbi:MAG: helix-turn-helix transcriptional regulator [Symbiobacteriia bacterium]